MSCVDLNNLHLFLKDRCMKFYNLDTEFTFGKFAGSTIRQIIHTQPTYLNWCVINLDHFYISEEIIEEIKSIKPDFKLSEEGIQKLKEKHDALEKQQEVSCNDYDDYYFERDTYSEFAGSYAQDVEGLSDNFINDALDGEPDAYWNID